MSYKSTYQEVIKNLDSSLSGLSKERAEELLEKMELMN